MPPGNRRVPTLFVGMLGNGYGWHLTGEGDEALLETTMKIGYEEYPWVEDYQDRNVTELEIFHGALRNTEDNDAMNAFSIFAIRRRLWISTRQKYSTQVAR